MESRPLKPSSILGGVLVCLIGVSTGSLISQSATSPARPSTRSAKASFDFFRLLLAASPAEREKLLAGKNQKDRESLLEGLRKYDELRPEVRELRVNAMELRFHIAWLMPLAPSNRIGHLQNVPPRQRSLVEERLRIWDQLPTEEQKELLEKERLARVTSILIPPPVPGQRGVPMSTIASNQLQQLQARLKRFQSLPEPKQQQIQNNFERIFGLPDAQKAREAIGSLQLPEAERAQMEKTLATFRALPKMQRDVCIQNFKKFAQLPFDEIRQFICNAEAWQKMTPQERQEWRGIVSKLPPIPPSPPGFGQPPRPTMIIPQPKPDFALTNSPN